VVVRDSRGLTARQAAILQFIEQSVRERGYPPTLREIGAHMKIKSTNGVNDHLVAIERKGYLRREPTAARGLSIVTPGQTELERRREQLRAELAAVEAQLGGVSHAA
jgi:repressor LexA